MAKKSKNKFANLLSGVNERSVLIVLAVILLISVAVLIVRDKRGTQLIDPVTVEQSATE
jgi:hypothetical protein